MFLGVPLHLFFLSVFFGLMPYNYICVTSGAILSQLRDVSDIMTWTNIGKAGILQLRRGFLDTADPLRTFI